MNNKLLLSAALCCLMSLSGCAYLPKQQNKCVGANCSSSAPAQPVVAESTNSVCQTNPKTGLCETDPFVNYSKVAADYRAYGERTPRDQLISQSGAGNNLTASIPPSIDDEVVIYEQIAVGPVPASAQTPAAPVAATAAQQAPAASVDKAPTPVVSENIEIIETFEDNQVSDNPKDPVQDWIAEEGQNLKLLLTEWSNKSGWRLVWNTNRNYVLNAGAMFRGRFADVSAALIRAFARARPAPVATFYKGNRVLVVETLEDENAYE